MKLTVDRSRAVLHGASRAFGQNLARFWTVALRDGTVHLPLRSIFALRSHYSASIEFDESVSRWVDGITRPERVRRMLHPALRRDQADLIVEAIRSGSLGIAYEAGGGKTLIALELARFYGRTLILVPPGIADAYLDDYSRFYCRTVRTRHGQRSPWSVGVRLGRWKRQAPYKHFNLSWGVTGDSRAKSERVRCLRRRAGAYLLSPWTVGGAAADEILDTPWAAVIVDESTLFRNPDTKIAGLLLDEFRPHFPHRFLLTADPQPSSVGDMWSQVEFVRPGTYPSFDEFADQYGEPGPFGGYVFRDPDLAEAALVEARPAFRVVRSEVFWPQAPPHEKHLIPVAMSASQQTLYDGLVEDHVARLGDQRVEVTMRGIDKVMKLRQITGGTFIDPSGRRIVVGTAKLKALDRILSKHATERVVVWCHFVAEYDLLSRWLTKKRIRHGVYRGADAESLKVRRRFQRGKLRVLVANPASAGHGVRLHAGTVAVHYTLDYDKDNHYQATKRLHRPPQRRRVVSYYLIARGTIDEHIYARLRERIGLREMLERTLGVRSTESVA